MFPDVSVAGPKDLTSCPHNVTRRDVIDIFLVKEVLASKLRVIRAMDSDHFSVVVDISDRTPNHESKP